MVDRVLKLRGLPFSADKLDIIDFFDGCKIRDGVDGIVMVAPKGTKPSGEAYVEMDSDDDHKLALTYDHRHMGSRYIEVCEVPKEEMVYHHLLREKLEAKYQRYRNGDESDVGFVRVRGLPFDCAPEHLVEFFTGLPIVPDGIVLPFDERGRATSQAWVKFADSSDIEKTLARNGEKIRHRYIEVFRCSKLEYDAAYAKHYGKTAGHRGSYPYYPGPGMIGYGYPPPPPPPYNMRPYRSIERPNAYDRYGPARAHPYAPPPYRAYPPPPPPPPPPPVGASRRPYDSVPPYPIPPSSYPVPPSSYPPGYPTPPLPPPNRNQQPKISSNAYAIRMRGLPFKATEEDVEEFFAPLKPIAIDLLKNQDGYPTGDADVEFATHEEAKKALAKDKANMGSRYIELFLKEPGKEVPISKYHMPPPKTSMLPPMYDPMYRHRVY